VGRLDPARPSGGILSGWREPLRSREPRPAEENLRMLRKLALVAVACVSLAAPAWAGQDRLDLGAGSRQGGGGPGPAVPEPAALVVFGVGAAIIGLAITRRRR
jgi:hypothetical protein